MPPLDEREPTMVICKCLQRNSHATMTSGNSELCNLSTYMCVKLSANPERVMSEKRGEKGEKSVETPSGSIFLF